MAYQWHLIFKEMPTGILTGKIMKKNFKCQSLLFRVCFLNIKKFDFVTQFLRNGSELQIFVICSKILAKFVARFFIILTGPK